MKRRGPGGFEVTWEADDGYVGSRPHSFTIDADELDDCESIDEDGIKRIFWDCTRSDFEEKVSFFSEDEQEFLEWAKQVIAERAKEEQ